MRICSDCGSIANGKRCTSCGSENIVETSNHCQNKNCKNYNKPVPLIDELCIECLEPTSKHSKD